MAASHAPRPYPDPTDRSAQFHQRARRVIPDGVSRSTLLVRPYPLYVERGEGAWLFDVDGRRYLDAHNNYTAIIAGHAHPAIIDAVSAQLGRGSAFSMATEAELLLAEELCARVAGFQQIRFCNSGTEAVMMAIKAARGLTGRPAIAKVEGSYHGAYDHVELSLDSDPDRWGPDHAPAAVPYGRGTPAGVLADTVVLPAHDGPAAVALIEAHGPRLAAVILDGMSSRLGLPEPDPAYLAAVADAARQVGALFVLDEVITFRLGRAGLQGQLRLQPDLTTLGKIIGGGFPVGAVAGSTEAMSVFAAGDGDRAPVPAGGTFSANTVTMVAGLACLSLLDEGAFAQLDQHGHAIRSGMAAIFEELGLAGKLSGAGSLLRIHPHRRTIRGYRDTRHVGQEAALMAALHREMANRGVHLTTYGLACISLAWTGEEVALLLDAFRSALEALAGRWPRAGDGREPAHVANAI